jgi:hypothetical protein
MTVTETGEATSEDILVETIADPETGAEIVFSAATESELEEAIEAYFDPFHENNNDGDSIA